MVPSKRFGSIMYMESAAELPDRHTGRLGTLRLFCLLPEGDECNENDHITRGIPE